MKTNAITALDLIDNLHEQGRITSEEFVLLIAAVGDLIRDNAILKKRLKDIEAAVKKLKGEG